MEVPLAVKPQSRDQIYLPYDVVVVAVIFFVDVYDTIDNCVTINSSTKFLTHI